MTKPHKFILDQTYNLAVRGGAGHYCAMANAEMCLDDFKHGNFNGSPLTLMEEYAARAIKHSRNSR
jgi:hypothetical protein